MVALPLIGFLSLFLQEWTATLSRKVPLPDWRDSFAVATLAWGWAVYAMTELLGAMHALTRPWLVMAWTLFSMSTLYLFARRARTLPGGPVHLLRSLLPSSPIDKGSLLILAAVLGVVLLSGFLAVVAPSNSFDVVRYHLARVAHWAQNASVGHYAVADSHQLWLPPWSEYAQLHLLLLLGNDHLANLVQWFSMFALAVVASRIAGQLGASTPGQVAAGAFVASAPPIMNQASMAATDLVPAYWTACAAWLVVRPGATAASWKEWLLLGAAGGLGLLAKGTSVVYMAPLFVWFGLSQIRRGAPREWTIRVLAIVGILLVAGGPMWARNWISFGSPFGSENVQLIANQPVGLRPLVSNFLRNLSLEAAMPFDRWNAGIALGVGWLHSVMGADVGDPRTTFSPYEIVWYWPGENSSPLHLLLIITCLAELLINPEETRRKSGAVLGICALAGLALFGTVFKWQDSMRFQLPLLGLMAPVVGTAVSQGRWRSASAWVSALLLAAVIPTVAMDRWRPLVRVEPFVSYRSVLLEAREDIYFRSAENLHAPYRAAAEGVFASGCRELGLRIDSHDREYLWWVVLDPSRNGIRIEHLLVYPGLEKYQDPDFEPCAVICTVCDASWGEARGLRGEEVGEGVWVFLPGDRQ
jgi:hypothetical protein